MVSKYLIEQILQYFPHQPTGDQEIALDKLSSFIMDRDTDKLFVLKGYAGTGKSSLVGALVKAMTALKQKTVLLAPTGRAAKVFSQYADHPAYTIHKKIYRQKKFSPEIVGFELNFNPHKHTLFIVDEASMIPNNSSDSQFGTGRLLEDLIQYVYTGENCRLVLMGDSAQLPPVGEEISPAFNDQVLRSFGLGIEECTLKDVIRQQQASGILYNATKIRLDIMRGTTNDYPQIEVKDFPDIIPVKGDELIETISSAFDRDGIEETIVISRSNKRTNIYNNGIRNSILYREEELSYGDRLMIVKNNYYWGEKYEEIDFLANGDMAEVRKIWRTEDMYDFRFADVTIELPDYETDMEVKILLDTLHSETTALSREQSNRLFVSILEDYSDISTKAGKMKKLKEDPFYNCLQVKYGYALTCHKAQGGQWKNVFLDIGYVTKEQMGTDFYRWLYTAFTRATDKLYLVNIKDKFII
ncbi:MAG: AAA family ATPase [Candidatus Azobacteroides sp.]|nr:AAA family ATPase [Candidatus Azobacteroides sp.]